MAGNNPSMNRIEIGENIRKRREALRVSQQELGLRLGTNANAVYLYESAHREIGSNRLCQIADALQTIPSSLLPQRYAMQMDIRASRVNLGFRGAVNEKTGNSYANASNLRVRAEVTTADDRLRTGVDTTPVPFAYKVMRIHERNAPRTGCIPLPAKR